MLASRAHSRHPTWPPSVHLLPDLEAKSPRSLPTKASFTATLPEITEDEDPFSHFLSPVLDEETTFDFDDLDSPSYTAGISSSARKDALFRARLEEKWETFVARRLLSHKTSSSASSSIMAPLPPPFPQEPIQPCTPPNEDAMPDLSDDLPSPSSTGPGSPDAGEMKWYFPSSISDVASDDDEDSDMDLDLDDDAEMLDGWEADRQAASEAVAMAMRGSTGRRRRRFGTRNGSGKRRVWREPSAELWTVEEEVEDLTTEAEGARGRKGKRQKRVSWNEEVEVVEYER